MKNNLVRRAGTVDKWLEDDGLMLIECWSRDGYTIEDIANKIGVEKKTIYDWRANYPEIDTALRNGREIVDYKVENALLKSALGYKKKEVKVTTIMRYGKVVETTREVTESEQAPNVNAIQTWLYNRQKEKWKNMNAKQNMFEDMVEDDTIEVIVRRAGANENGSEDSEENEVVDKDIVLRKRSEKEQKDIKNEKAKKEKAKKQKESQHIEVIEEKGDGYDPERDEWPEDWEDDE